VSPRKLRVPKLQRPVQGRLLSPAELARRGRWGGLLREVPPLLPEEWPQFLDLHAATWAPQRCLSQMWETVDDEAGWSGAVALEKLQEDAIAVADFLERHPEQAARLAAWRERMRALIAERDAATDAMRWRGVYQRLVAAGYSPLFAGEQDWDDDGEGCDDDQ
jgi:hypothetical protein